MNPPPEFDLTWGREVNSGGLPLWRLGKASGDGVACLVFELPGVLYLVLTNEVKGPVPPVTAERHTDLVTLFHRSETLKHALVQQGWIDRDAP